MGAAPDMLRENKHACLLPQGSQLRTALRCTHAGGLQRLESETDKETATATGVQGLVLEIPRPREIFPTPGLNHTPFLLYPSGLRARQEEGLSRSLSMSLLCSCFLSFPSGLKGKSTHMTVSTAKGGRGFNSEGLAGC